MKVTALLNFWNAKLWLPYCLEALYPAVDALVVTESCWVKPEGPDALWTPDRAGPHGGMTSPDGSAQLVRDFIAHHDPQGKVFFHQAGEVESQPQGRNAGLYAVPHDTDWIWLVDADEFYLRGTWQLLREVLRRCGPEVGAISVDAKCFYFDFTRYKVESFQRLWRWFPGQCFTQIASMKTPRGQAIHLKDHPLVQAVSPDQLEYFHYSYVGEEWTRVKGCMGEDLPAERYRAWWEGTFRAFDGGNLEELYAGNGGGIHVLGGGALLDYPGRHPQVLDPHPLRHWRWEGPGSEAQALGQAPEGAAPPA